MNGAGHAAEGTLFPQAWIERPTGPMRMDDALGCGWRLFLHTPADETWTHAATFAHTDLQLTVQHLNAPGFTESSGVLSAWFDRMACQAALVRPDHYVYGAFATPQDLQRTLEALRP